MVLNASTTIINGVNTLATYIAPLRALAAATAVFYNSGTSELSYLTSSSTTKSDIHNLSFNTACIYDLSAQTYLYNSDISAGTQIGYIAEDVENVSHFMCTYNYPYMQSNDPDNPPAAINYDVIVVFLVEELKKLKAANEALAERVSELENAA